MPLTKMSRKVEEKTAEIRQKEDDSIRNDCENCGTEDSESRKMVRNGKMDG